MLSNLHCLAFVLLKRSSAPKIWSNHCPRVQKVNFRLTCVAQKRPCINSWVTAHFYVAREAGLGLCRTGHFRVPKTLTFKMRLGAQPFLWKWVFMKMKNYLHINGWAPTLVLKQARGNSEMAYYTLRLFKGLILTQFPAQSRNNQWKKRKRPKTVP